jgi:hypothetical protein
MTTGEKETIEEGTAKYRVVELEALNGTTQEVEMSPEFWDQINNYPDPEVRRRFALAYESAKPTNQRILEKEGYKYCPSKSFPSGRHPTFKAKVAGIKGLVEIERTPANMAREFECSETSIRRALEKSEKRDLQRG